MTNRVNNDQDQDTEDDARSVIYHCEDDDVQIMMTQIEILVLIVKDLNKMEK